jgi:hypothetical protein
VVALPTTAEGYAYSNGSAVRFGGSAAHKVRFLQYYSKKHLMLNEYDAFTPEILSKFFAMQ